jgi:hypothetical protein
MSPVGLANTRISIGYAQESPQSLVCSPSLIKTRLVAQESVVLCTCCILGNTACGTIVFFQEKTFQYTMSFCIYNADT